MIKKNVLRKYNMNKFQIPIDIKLHTIYRAFLNNKFETVVIPSEVTSNKVRTFDFFHINSKLQIIDRLAFSRSSITTFEVPISATTKNFYYF